MSPRDRVSQADVEAFCWNFKARTVLNVEAIYGLQHKSDMVYREVMFL